MRGAGGLKGFQWGGSGLIGGGDCVTLFELNSNFCPKDTFLRNSWIKFLVFSINETATRLPAN